MSVALRRPHFASYSRAAKGGGRCSWFDNKSGVSDSDKPRFGSQYPWRPRNGELNVTGGITSRRLDRTNESDGNVNDEIVRDDDGEWRFAKRTFRFIYIETVTRADQVMKAFPRDA